MERKERMQLDLRQQLARDGARLGKFVGAKDYKRWNFNPAMEHWEEGFAIQAVHRKKMELKRKRQVFEEKLKGGYQAWWKSVNGAAVQEDGGVDPMEQEEFEASIRIHLEELKQKENALSKEEMTLRAETSKHQSALKRLSNEDQSRFKSHSEQNPRVGLFVFFRSTCHLYLKHLLT